MSGAICIWEGLVPFSVSPSGRFNLVSFSMVLILLNVSLAVFFLGGTLNYLKQKLQSALLKTWRGWWTICLRIRSHQLPSHSSCMRRREVKSLQTRKDAFFTSCHGFFRRCFFPAVPQEHVHHFYWKTQHRALLIKKKQPQTKGGELLSWADLISVSCSGKFGLFFFFFVWLNFDNCFIFSTML